MMTIRYLSILLLLLFIVSFVVCDISVNDDDNNIEDKDSEEEDAPEVYERTYSEAQTQLQRNIFNGYRISKRPVRNESTPTVVKLHFMIMHYSIDTQERAITVHGQLYMTWIDEFLGWDVKEYNGIRRTQCKKWMIWNPKLRIANTLSGVAAMNEISSQGHVTIRTKGVERGARVEMYPTFSIKVGCHFNYDGYPFDVNKCDIVLFSTELMNDIQLENYYDGSSYSLSWNKEDKKTIISDFEILNTSSKIQYNFKGLNITDIPPYDANDLFTTWSVLTTTIHFRRHTVLFGIIFILPTIVSAILITFSFFHVSLFVAISSYFFTAILRYACLHDMVTILPPGGYVPPIVTLDTISEVILFFCIILHIFFLSVSQWKESPHHYVINLLVLLKLLRIKNGLTEENCTWKDVVFITRVSCGCILLFFYVITIIPILIIHYIF